MIADLTWFAGREVHPRSQFVESDIEATGGYDFLQFSDEILDWDRLLRVGRELPSK